MSPAAVTQRRYMACAGPEGAYSGPASAHVLTVRFNRGGKFANLDDKLVETGPDCT